MKAYICVKFAKDVPDYEGLGLKNALNSAGFDEVKGLRKGLFLTIVLKDNNNFLRAGRYVHRMCRELLARAACEQYCFVLKRDNEETWGPSWWYYSDGNGWQRSDRRYNALLNLID